MQAPLAIVLPEPCLVVLIGAAGSGKSTLAARLFRPGVILSSDTYRAILTGDEADQRASRTAFAILHRDLERRMAARQTTVVDATNVTPYARRGLLRRAAAHGVPAVAIAIDLPPAVVIARNAARAARVVPELVVSRQLNALARSLAPGVLQAEGFAAVYRVSTPAALDGLTVRTAPSP